jgi:hypothetical protein
VTYQKDIKPILEASCFRCHGPERPKANLRLDSLEGVLKGSENGKILVRGDSKKSLIVAAVARLDEDFAMPPKPKPPRQGGAGNPGNRPDGGSGDGGSAGGPGGGPKNPGPPPKPLTPEQVGLVRAWIDQGAK